MSGSILFVCAANVCRSPLMQYTFADAVPDTENWAVTSAGVSARAGAVMCEIALASLRSPSARSAASAHRSARVEDEDLEADLVIVASRAERAEIARRAPEARSRVFTLSEAVLLGRDTATEQRSRTSSVCAIGQYAQMLDENRGMLVIPRAGRARLLRRAERTHLLDIPDGHQRRRGAHASVLKRVRAEVEELSEQILGFVGAR